MSLHVEKINLGTSTVPIKCVAYSILSIPETRARAQSFFLGNSFYEVVSFAFLTNGLFSVKHVGLELTTLHFESPFLTTTPQHHYCNNTTQKFYKNLQEYNFGTLPYNTKKQSTQRNLNVSPLQHFLKQHSFLMAGWQTSQKSL